MWTLLISVSSFLFFLFLFMQEVNHMVKYGLRPNTLKGELFKILSEGGANGLKVSELAISLQVSS